MSVSTHHTVIVARKVYKRMTSRDHGILQASYPAIIVPYDCGTSVTVKSGKNIQICISSIYIQNWISKSKAQHFLPLYQQ